MTTKTIIMWLTKNMAIFMLLGLVMILFIGGVCNKEEDDPNGEVTDGCPEAFNYEGQTYHGIMIGEQCWMKENLNYETGTSWCYGDNPANCEQFGRLYNWNTIMNGEDGTAAMPSGVRGICPEGWHIPSDLEWQVLEGTVDSKSEPYSGIWYNLAYRGYDVGLNLKSVTGWEENNGNSGGGTDAFGFTILPGGFKNWEAEYHGIAQEMCFWTCTDNTEEDALLRQLSYSEDRTARYYALKTSGFYLRCVKD
jgi:uncharacterized protein (TIGR02145 family)